MSGIIKEKIKQPVLPEPIYNPNPNFFRNLTNGYIEVSFYSSFTDSTLSYFSYTDYSYYYMYIF